MNYDGILIIHIFFGFAGIVEYGVGLENTVHNDMRAQLDAFSLTWLELEYLLLGPYSEMHLSNSEPPDNRDFM